MNDHRLHIQRLFPTALHHPTTHALNAYRKTNERLYAGPLHKVINGELQPINKHPDTHPYKTIVDYVELSNQKSQLPQYDHTLAKKVEIVSGDDFGIQNKGATLDPRQITKETDATNESKYHKTEDNYLSTPPQNDLIMIAHEWGIQLFRTQMLMAHANLRLPKERTTILTTSSAKKHQNRTPKIIPKSKAIIVGGALFVTFDLLIAFAFCFG